MFKTLAQVGKNSAKINFFIFETNTNNILRNFVLFSILKDSEITLREKIETFIDFYYNQLITQKTVDITSSYLKIIQEEINSKKTACNGFFNLKSLKYRQRDDLSERIDLWLKLLKNIKYLKEKCFEYRDDRLRFLYKDRYDYRTNLIDADYVWGITHSEFPMHSILLDKQITFRNDQKENLDSTNQDRIENTEK